MDEVHQQLQAVWGRLDALSARQSEHFEAIGQNFHSVDQALRALDQGLRSLHSAFLGYRGDSERMFAEVKAAILVLEQALTLSRRETEARFQRLEERLAAVERRLPAA